MIKVCIIEDEPEIRKLLRLIIEKQEGFQVVPGMGLDPEQVEKLLLMRKPLPCRSSTVIS